jgi:hypothetical protein
MLLLMLVAATELCTTVASIRNIKEPALPFVGEVVVAIDVATTRCARVAASTQFKPELNNSPFTETRSFLKKFF